MAFGFTSRTSTLWRGFSGRLYPCAIHEVATMPSSLPPDSVVALSIARDKGIATQVAKPIAGPLSPRLFEAAKKVRATELHAYALHPSDDARAIITDLRSAS